MCRCSQNLLFASVGGTLSVIFLCWFIFSMWSYVYCLFISTQAEKEWKSVEDKQRYLRLQLLLEKSNIYCQFLLEKMERQKLEARKQQEKTAHQLEKKQSKEKDSVQMVIPIKETCTTKSFWVQAQAEKCHKIFVDFKSIFHLQVARFWSCQNLLLYSTWTKAKAIWSLDILISDYKVSFSMICTRANSQGTNSLGKSGVPLTFPAEGQLIYTHGKSIFDFLTKAKNFPYMDKPGGLNRPRSWSISPLLDP